MKKKRKRPQKTNSSEPTATVATVRPALGDGPELSTSQRFSIAISVLALLVSSFSANQSCEARRLSYRNNRPALRATVELVGPIEPAKPVNLKTVLLNDGPTVARAIKPELRFLIAPPSDPFKAEYPPGPDAWGNKPAVVQSDLNPRSESAFYFSLPTNLAHDHDVEAVVSGAHHLYVFGRVPYVDADGGSHEFHFCSVYRRVAGLDPLKLAKCEYYNETVDH